MRAALLVLAFSLPAMADLPTAVPCALKPGTCTTPDCSNDATQVGDECVQWDPVSATDLAGYFVKSYGVDCLWVPREQSTTALISETGCFRADRTAQITIVAIDTGGLISTGDSNSVTFDAPVVCLRHTNCRTEIDRATQLPTWTCDGCEARCSPTAPLFTTRAPCP